MNSLNNNSSVRHSQELFFKIIFNVFIHIQVDIADWFWMRLAASLKEAHVSATRQLSFDESVNLQQVQMELLPDTDDENESDDKPPPTPTQPTQQNVVQPQQPPR